MENESKKNYRIVFWALFGVGMVLNLISIFANKMVQNTILSVLVFIGSIVLLVLWMKNLNQAWRSIGKKHGWIVGLVTLVPFGPLIAIVIAHHYLKGADYWRGEYKILNYKDESHSVANHAFPFPWHYQ